MNRALLSQDEQQAYIAGERDRARGEVALFMDRIKADGMSAILKPTTSSIADTICETANEVSAQLILMGTCGRSLLARALMGSVTEGVLRSSDRDVLVIPPPQAEAEA